MALTGAKKPSTMLSKRNVHNVGKIMAPLMTQIPMIPITNTELIVYFFNSISRPMCALRLYVQNVGPSSITNTLNEHREVDPPYLRNTCSVKCVSAIREGSRRFGADWEATYRPQFEIANNNGDIEKATDLIRIPNKDSDDAVDLDVLDLLNGLKQHPQEGQGAGLFTRCIQYCEEHKLSYPLSQVHILAAALQEGRSPPPPTDDESDEEMEPIDTSLMNGLLRAEDADRASRETSPDSDGDTVVDDTLYGDLNVLAARAGRTRPMGKENGHPEDEVPDDMIEMDFSS